MFKYEKTDDNFILSKNIRHYIGFNLMF